MARLVSTGSVRPLKMSSRALTGRVSMSGGAVAEYESSLERDWLIALDFDWRVVRIQEQPYTLSYELNGEKRRYTPDVLVVFDDGKAQWTVVYEVKGREDLWLKWSEHRPRYKAAVHDCRAKGWRFRIVTEREIRTPYLSNIKFLRRYRDLTPLKMHKEALLYSLRALGPTTPQALLAAVWWDEDKQLMALTELWRLVSTREIGASLETPLTMSTQIWLP